MNTPKSLQGLWTYRSFIALDDLSVDYQLNNNPPVNYFGNNFEFGSGYIRIDDAPFNDFKGKIFGPNSDQNPNPVKKPYSWELDLKGSINYGNPVTLRFQGKGIVGGSEWIYDYLGYYVNPWPNGVNQIPSIVGTIVRTIPHPDGSGGTAPAGVVANWIAVRYSDGK